MAEYTSVRSPRWANAQHRRIDCFVKFAYLKKEVPFTADPDDVEPHGREIFARCVAGEFGEVGEYVPVPEPEPVEIVAGGGVPKLVQGWPEVEEFLNQANAEVASGTSRGVILVWSTMIEAMLGRILESFLADNAISRKLIWDDAQSSLGTFSGRSKACFALGLISRRELTVCDKIRAVRNAAAHEWNLDLSNNALKRALKALYDLDHAELYEWIDNDLRFLITHVYAGSCGFLAVRLAERLVDIAGDRRAEWDDA